jgi:nicotinamide-nucleotide amidase
MASGTTLAVAESLTAGMVCAALAEVPGVSAVLRGGVVAYATDVKTALLGVDADLLDVEGPVHEDVAAQMAEGARRTLGADLGLATTGVAGPGAHGGVAAGTVVVAVADDRSREVRRLLLAGDRVAVRHGAAEAVIVLALEHLDRVSPTHSE